MEPKVRYLVIACSLMICACGQPEKVNDRDYYKTHTDEAKSVLEKCASGDMSGDNCANARWGLSSAKAQAAYDKYKDK